MADRKRGLERRGKPAGGPAVLMLNKARTHAPAPQKNHGSWWAVPDAEFATALAKRSGDSWGEFRNKQLTLAANEGRPDPPPQLREFAPRKA